MSRVTVDLPLVPVMDTTGIVRSASRIHAGGVARASVIRASQPATQRAWVPVRRTRRAADTERAARSTAASATRRARSAPHHGQVMTQRPASDARWTSTGPPCSP
jgi:hypothetical protein